MNINFFSGKEQSLRNPAMLVLGTFLKWYIVIGALLRVVLMFSTPTETAFSVWEMLRFFAVGVCSDIGMGVLLGVPMMILYLGLNEWKYGRWAGWAIDGLLLAAFVYVMCFHSLLDEYGGGAPRIGKLFLGWKLMSFSLRFFVPRIRQAWRRVSLYFAWATYVFLLLCVAAGEYFFWEEFGVRYNFIAVDYLVYTHEVIGNIMESYAIVPLVVLALLLTAAVLVWESRKRGFRLVRIYSPLSLVLHLIIYVALCLAGFFVVNFTSNLPAANQYVNQLEQNGAYDFVRAFRSNKLDYDRFYAMIPAQECRLRYREMTGLDDNYKKWIGADTAAQYPNIVLVTVESLSAGFLQRYGNTNALTPNLDKLMARGMVFDSLYATGNRTVRGLEALSLCIPPSAGESIVKRSANYMGTLSLGYVLDSIGYKTQFLYGGDSYFDNMGDYFSCNNYDVIDRKQLDKDEITFANIWGVCDGDLFNKALKVFDANARSRKPFFAQIMTTSNHRPFTYPEGLIKVEGNPNTRDAAVKYTDYAIGKFLRDAASKSWFDNTVFVIIADHCASSAGKTSLPVEGYHIPCIVYAPKLVHPQVISSPCSQIDVMPTLLSLLGVRAKVGFAGQDVLSPDYRPRAFMATYQDLGYLENGRLTVLSPVRKVTQYTVNRLKDGAVEQLPVTQLADSLVRKAQAFYQYVNLYIKPSSEKNIRKK